MPKTEKTAAKKSSSKSATEPKVSKRSRDEGDEPAPKASKRVRVVASSSKDESWRKTYLAAINAEVKFGEAIRKFTERGEEDVREAMSKRATLEAEMEEARMTIQDERAAWEAEKAELQRQFEKDKRVEQADWQREKDIRDADEARDSKQRKQVLEDQLTRRREEATIEFDNAVKKNKRDAVAKFAKEEGLEMIDSEELDALRSEVEALTEQHAKELAEVKAKTTAEKESALSSQKRELTLVHEKEMARAEAAAEAVEARMQMYKDQISDLKESMSRQVTLTESVAASTSNAASKGGTVYVESEGGAGKSRRHRGD